MERESRSTSDFVSSTKLQIANRQGNYLDRSFVGDGGYGGGGCLTSGGPNEAGGSVGNFGSSNLQAFNICNPSYPTISYGREMMNFPFTCAQLKELERQALIYKYMISSVPLPLHLLSRNFSAAPGSSLSSMYSGRYARNGDPEPGRCKRTDGKKWRCSKEVAPQQKYCERHLHRGRPRSRKPVEEAKDQKKTRLDQNKTLPTVVAPLNAKTDLTISPPPYNNREGKIAASEQEWETLMKSNCYIPQEYIEQQHPLDAFSYPFIDAWSMDNSANTKASMSLNDVGDLSPSLNLSMAMAAAGDREVRNINSEDRKGKDSMWLNRVPWEPFLGPLGEALQASNPASPYTSISTPVTAASSPSGVLHWAVFSQSDSSVCSSPTFVAPPGEGSNQLHN